MENTTKLILNQFWLTMLIPAFMYGDLWMFIASFWWYVIAIVAISGGYRRYYSTIVLQQANGMSMW